MKTPARLTAVAVATTLACGTAAAVAGPAQAFVDFHNCPSDYLCLYSGTGWTGTTLFISRNALIRGLVPLNGRTGYSFDNRTGSAVNHTLMDVRLTQFTDCFSGGVWRIDAFHTANFAGRYFNDRASCAARVP